MPAKRAAMGFRGVTLAPITINTDEGYACAAGVALPYASGMTHTRQESITKIYSDDELYTQVNGLIGEEVELRMAEVSLSRMAALGLGAYDSQTETLEGGFTPVSSEFAMRFVVDTASGLPYYINYRVFELTGITFDKFATRKDSASVSEVIITGIFKQPKLAELKPMAIMQLKEDRSNAAACTAFLSAAETKP